MRKRQTYLLTVLTKDRDDVSIRGRIKAISSGKLANFTSIEELFELLIEDLETHDGAAPDSADSETPQAQFS